MNAENELLRKAIETESEWPLPLPILRPDHRMLAQQGCFVVSGKLSGEKELTPIENLMSCTSHEQLDSRNSMPCMTGRYYFGAPTADPSMLIRKI